MAKPRKFTVGFVDLSSFYQAKIVTLVESLAEDEGFPWIPLGTDSCDLLIASTEAIVSPLDHQLVVRLIDEGESAPGLTLQVPVTRLSLIELLNKAEESLNEKAQAGVGGLRVKRLPRGDEAGEAAPRKIAALNAGSNLHETYEGSDPEPAAARGGAQEEGKIQWERPEAYGNAPSPSSWRQRLSTGNASPEVEPAAPPRRPASSPSLETVNDQIRKPPQSKPGSDAWTEVALTLYSLMQNNAQAIAEISIAGTETVNIDFRFRAYQSTASVDWLPSEPMHTSIRTVRAEPNWPPAFALPGKPLDSFLWFVGINAFSGGAAPWLKPEERYRLQRWPNFTEINHSMDDMRMTALLGNTFMNASELSAAAGVRIEAATRLVNAYSLMGLLQASVQEATKPAAAAVREDSKSKPSPSLFSRLFKKLGR